MQEAQSRSDLLAELARACAAKEAERAAASASALTATPAAVDAEAAFLANAVQIAGHLERLFELPCPDAPGLSLVGAQFGAGPYLRNGSGPFSATGKGTDRLSALTSCIGESVEQLSRQLWGDEPIVRLPANGRDGEPLRSLLESAGYPPGLAADPDFPPDTVDWVPAQRLRDAGAVLVPASLCYQDAADRHWPRPRVRLGSGTAAGQTVGAACLHGMLELIERDAVALWWLGGRRARSVAPAVLDAADAATLLARLRRGRSDRTTWLLDITNDLGIASLAALSCDRQGRMLACGFAARLRAEDAVRAAILEMCQAEIEIHLVGLKRRQQGDGALNDLERQFLERCLSLDVAQCDLLHPDGGGSPDHRDSGPQWGLANRPGADPVVVRLARHLSGRGIDIYAVDITRPRLGIPAVRVLADGLQPPTPEVMSDRLRAQIDETGGGYGLVSGISVL